MIIDILGNGLVRREDVSGYSQRMEHVLEEGRVVGFSIYVDFALRSGILLPIILRYNVDKPEDGKFIGKVLDVLGDCFKPHRDEEYVSITSEGIKVMLELSE